MKNHSIRKKLVLLSLLLGCGVSYAFADFSAKDAGTSAAAFLKIGASARPIGMGDAYVGIADDLNAIQSNPSGLATFNQKELIATRAQLFQDITYNFFSFAYPTPSYGTLAVGYNSVEVPNIEQRTTDTDNPNSIFSSNDAAYTLAYAKKVWDPSHQEMVQSGLDLGVSLKYIHQTLLNYSSDAYAADVGSLYQFSEIPLSLGFAMQNVGSKVKYNSDSDPLPFTIQLGSSYRIGGNRETKSNSLLLADELDLPRDDNPSVRIGAELTLSWMKDLSTSIRGGYQTRQDRTIEGTTTGIGFTYKMFSFDFAWVPFGVLGDNYRYSVKLRF